MEAFKKEMKYTMHRLNPPEILARGTYNNLDYYIINMGTHPCAYIDVSDTKLANVKYSEINIDCHGGLTYSRDYLVGVHKKGWFIGWDYGHYGDFIGNDMFSSCFNKKWTTDEILVHCKQVIEQIV